jgi:2,4-dienoyl-CoA reductase-like NADH-dependent reductase (Old Yellow Enzyme family)
MARYFKYKSAADVVSDATRLGGELAVQEDLAPLFSPLTVAGRTVGNRLLIQPMEGCDGTLEGAPDELTYRRYQRFGAGGAKVIWGEATAIAPDVRANTRQLWISDRTAADLGRMLDGARTAHRAAGHQTDDLLIGLQLTHSGRYSVPRPWLATHDPLLAPLTIDKTTGRKVDASYPLLSDDDLKRIEDQYVAAARLAHQIGCDFVDLKQCHRYLLSELLAARNRPGIYGGSFENRTRLILNVVRRIRAEVPGLMLATRFNTYDGIPHRGVGTGDDFVGRPVPHELPLACAFGTDPNDPAREQLEEPIALAKLLVQAGVALLNVTMGNPYANPHLVRPAEFPPVDGYHAPEHPLLGVLRHFRIAAAIQRAVPGTPVAGSGYSWLQDFAPQAAAANVARGDVAFAGFGRATLSHPDFARSLAETGQLNRKLVCRTFSYCTGLMRAKDHPLGQYPTGCPPFDKEAYGDLWKEVEQKRKLASS